MKTLNYLMLVGILIFSTACKKDEVMENPTTDPIALSNFINDNVKEATQTYTVNAESTIFITGLKGTQLFLPANSLIDSDGNSVTGDVDFELIEIDRKSEMVLLNKPTNGRKTNGDYAPLVSTGEFYFNVSQNGENLTATAPLQVAAYTTEFSPKIRKFINTSETEDILWEMAEDSLIELIDAGDTSPVTLQAFSVLPDQWGWVNCDYFYSDPRPRTNISTLLPEEFIYTKVYFSIDGEKTLIDIRPIFELPIGLKGHFVSVGVTEDELYYSIQPTKITENHVQMINDFVETTDDELTSLIDALP